MTLRELHQDLCSRIAETRGRAMNRLVLWLRKEPSIGQAVLPMFRAAIDGETDAWAASRAIEGLEIVLGFEASRESWQALLRRDDAVFVSRIAMHADAPHHVPLLLQLLNERREIPIRSCVIRMLGRSTAANAFEVIAAEITEPRLQQAVIDALGDLGDPRGLPLIEPFLTDQTPADRNDDRGAMLYVCNLAYDAIASIKRKLTTPPALPRERDQAP